MTDNEDIVKAIEEHDEKVLECIEENLKQDTLFTYLYVIIIMLMLSIILSAMVYHYLGNGVL